jgi:hypothetical protein
MDLIFISSFATDDDETVLCLRAWYKYTFLVDMQCSNVIPYTDIIVVFIGYTMDMLANIIYLLDATALAKPTCELTGSNDE